MQKKRTHGWLLHLPEYNIIINKVEKDIFLQICRTEIENLEKEIDMKNKVITSFRDAITDVKNSYED